MGNQASRPAPPSYPTPIPGLDAELQRVHGLCMAPWDEEAHARTLRPERPEYAARAGRPMVPTPEWERTLRAMRVALAGPRGWDLWYNRTPLEWFKEYEPGRRRLLVAAAAILLDTQCCGAPDPILCAPFLLDPCFESLIKSGLYGRSVLKPVLEHMLLVDYGLGEEPLSCEGSGQSWRFFQNIARPSFNAFCRNIVAFAAQCDWGVLPSKGECEWLIESTHDLYAYGSDQSFADISTMLYWFCTRRRKLTDDEYNRGLTGYTGVLQEMVLEVPTKGSDRLRRRLSVDVNLLIPAYVRSEGQRELLIATATNLALEHHIEITVPSKDIEYSKAGESSRLADNCTTASSSSSLSPQRYDFTEAYPPSYEESTKS